MSVNSKGKRRNVTKETPALHLNISTSLQTKHKLFEVVFFSVIPSDMATIFMVLSKSDPRSQPWLMALPLCSNILEWVEEMRYDLGLRHGKRTTSH